MKFGWIIFLFYWGSVCGGFGAKYAGESFGLDNIVGRIFFGGGVVVFLELKKNYIKIVLKLIEIILTC